jgi:hypothetical protein
MSDVSFFVTHGAAFWQALTGVSLAIGGLAAWKLVDRGMRARAARVREALGSAAPSPNPNDHGKPVTLSGTLQLEEDDASREAIAATVVPRGLEQSEEPTPKAKGSAAAGKKLSLDVAGVRVVLDGPIEILVGSRETERCIGRAQGQTLLWDFAGGLGALPPAFGARVLAAGDRVIARGVLRHDPQWGQSYREGSASFALDVEKGDSDLRTIVIAYEGRPRPLARPKTRTVSRALMAPLGVFVVLCAIGEAAVRLHSPLAWAVATATPFRRNDALGLLRDDVHLSTRATPERIDRAVDLDRLRGKCGDAADDAFAHHELARAATLAADCNEPWREAGIHVAAADFPRAADAFARARKRDAHLPFTLSEATAYIVAGKHDQAALALRGLARGWDDARAARARLECAALYEEHRDPQTGEPEAIASLEASDDRDGACSLLGADASRKAPAGNYYYWSGRQNVTDIRSTVALITMERSPADDLEVPTCWASAEDVVFDPRHCLYDVPPALLDSAIRSLEKGPHNPRADFRRAQLTLRLVRSDAYFGEIADARRHVADARALLLGVQGKYSDAELDERSYPFGNANPWDERVADADADARWMAGRARSERKPLDDWDLALDVRGADIPVRRGNDDWHTEMLFAAGKAKHGDVTALAKLADRDARDANQRLWQLALSNDDDALVVRLRDRNMDGRGVVDYLGANQRPELARWVRFDYPTACVTCGLYPLANQIVSRRDAAIAAHADDVATEMGAAARRIRDVLHDRNNAIVLAVISELSPP